MRLSCGKHALGCAALVRPVDVDPSEQIDQEDDLGADGRRSRQRRVPAAAAATGLPQRELERRRVGTHPMRAPYAKRRHGCFEHGACRRLERVLGGCLECTAARCALGRIECCKKGSCGAAHREDRWRRCFDARSVDTCQECFELVARHVGLLERCGGDEPRKERGARIGQVIHKPERGAPVCGKPCDGAGHVLCERHVASGAQYLSSHCIDDCGLR